MKSDNDEKMSPYDRWPGKRGVHVLHHGCDMFVLILIWIVLFVAVLPVVQLYIVKAQYQAEAMPTVGLLRVRTELYKCEMNQLPGLGVDSNGAVGTTSQLGPGLSKVQTVAATNAAFAADFGRKVEVPGNSHVLSQLGFAYGDLTGKRLRPQFLQYRVDACETNRYLYAVGAFGDSTKGSGLPSGTGYAVLEVQTGEGCEGEMAVWKRWKSKAEHPSQVILVNAAEAKEFFNCDSARQARTMNLCCIGDPEALLSPDEVVRERARAELREAGWEIAGEPPVPWYRKKALVLWAIPFVFCYVAVLALLLMERPFNWKCGVGLFLWVAVLVWSLPKSPFVPMGWLIGVWIVFGIGSCIWAVCAKAIAWIARHMSHKDGV